MISGAPSALSATLYADNIAPLAAGTARVRLINVLNNDLAFITLDEETVVQSSQASGREVDKGVFNAEFASLGLNSVCAASWC